MTDLLRRFARFLFLRPLVGAALSFVLAGLVLVHDLSGLFVFGSLFFAARLVDTWSFGGRVWDRYSKWARRRRDTNDFKTMWPGLAYDFGLSKRSMDGEERIPKLTEVRFDD